MSESFPQNHVYVLTKLFGDTPRVRILEFFIVTSMDAEGTPISHISQIARILKLSKSTVKQNIDDMIKSGLLIEKKIETHAQNPQRNVRINKGHLLITEMLAFYHRIKNIA